MHATVGRGSGKHGIVMRYLVVEREIMRKLAPSHR